MQVREVIYVYNQQSSLSVDDNVIIVTHVEVVY